MLFDLNVNYAMLVEQKKALYEYITESKMPIGVEHPLDGILNLLDEIQDQMENQNGDN